jgi:ring-1,2-phenylacetyl-CoA epoxidase subunit PaaC
MTSNLSPGSAEWVLAFADDEHMIGARHAAWIGLGPFLEEDLAFCSIAQDELGHAIALYDYVTDDLDRFALLRDPSAYRSAWLCELPCDHWDQALVRHWLYDQAEALRWEAVAGSSVDALRDLAARAEREERFHRDHAESYLRRISEGHQDGRDRIEAAVDALLPFACGLWEPVAGEPEALADGVVILGSEALAEQWTTAIQSELSAWGYEIEWPEAVIGQDQRRARSVEFAALQASLQEVISIDPDATW